MSANDHRDYKPRPHRRAARLAVLFRAVYCSFASDPICFILMERTSKLETGKHTGDIPHCETESANAQMLVLRRGHYKQVSDWPALDVPELPASNAIPDTPVRGRNRAVCARGTRCPGTRGY